MAQLSGSASTAASSETASGTLYSWLLWATKLPLQPPPVSRQYPVWMPEEMSPSITRSQLA